MRNKKLLLVIFIPIFVIFCNFLVIKVRAESLTGQVTATVTAQSISISLDNASVAFGTIGTTDTKDTTTGAKGVNDSTTATNDGNIVEDFDIQASNSTNWDLETPAAPEVYTMKFCTDNCDAAPTWSMVGRAAHTEYARLASSVASASANTRVFDLQVGTPTTTTQTGEQAITVTVRAAALP